jgi:4-amino-4-deoxy-L-arabinose transferase-like glycosyltransferase
MTRFHRLFSPSGLLPILLTLFCLGFFLSGSPALVGRILCPFQVNQGEAVNVEFARILGRGEPLYHDPYSGPYLYAAYPPLFPWLQASLMGIFRGPWLAGRLLAAGGYGGCALIFVLWGWRRWGPWPALTLGSLFLLSPTWAAWGTMVRTDSLMIFLEFSAFLLLLKAHEKKATREEPAVVRGILAAGGLTALALMLKQNAILLVLAYVVYCFRERKGRAFLLYSMAALLAPAVLFGFLQRATQGWFLKYVLLWTPLGYQPAGMRLDPGGFGRGLAFHQGAGSLPGGPMLFVGPGPRTAGRR